MYFHNESKATLGRIGRSVFYIVESIHACLYTKKAKRHWAASVVHNESKATLGRKEHARNSGPRRRCRSRVRAATFFVVGVWGTLFHPCRLLSGRRSEQSARYRFLLPSPGVAPLGLEEPPYGARVALCLPPVVVPFPFG
jgi:hypothetical protein